MRVDPAMAWEEWKRNSLAAHAEAYPDIWYGVWSGNDSYNSPLNKRPGGAANEPYFHGTDFPVLNLHSHACFLYSASKLLGLEFTREGLSLNLALPLDSYRFESPLVGVVKSNAGFEGWYAPARAGKWTVRIAIPKESAGKFSHIEANGKRIPIQNSPDGTIEIIGASTPAKPMRWALIKG